MDTDSQPFMIVNIVGSGLVIVELPFVEVFKINLWQSAQLSEFQGCCVRKCTNFKKMKWPMAFMTSFLATSLLLFYFGGIGTIDCVWEDSVLLSFKYLVNTSCIQEFHLNMTASQN